MGESIKHLSILSISNENLIIRNESNKTSSKYNIQYALKPLFQLQAIFAIRRTAANSWRNNLHSTAMATLLIVVTIISLREKLEMFKNVHPGFLIVEFLYVIIHLLTSLGNITVCAFHSKSEYAIFVARTKDIVTNLGHNVPATYKIIRIVVNNIIILLSMILFTLFAFDTYAFSFFFTTKQMLLSTFYNMYYVMNSLVFIHFVLTMYFARSAFLTINVMMLNIYKNNTSVKIKELEHYNSKNPLKYLFPWSIIARATVGRCTMTKYDLDMLMETYMANCDHCESVNEFFNVQVIFNYLFIMLFTDVLTTVRSIEL